MTKVYCVTTTFYVAEKPEGELIENIPEDDWEVLHVEERYATDTTGFNPLTHLRRQMVGVIGGLTMEKIPEEPEEE